MSLISQTDLTSCKEIKTGGKLSKKSEESRKQNKKTPQKTPRSILPHITGTCQWCLCKINNSWKLEFVLITANSPWRSHSLPSLINICWNWINFWERKKQPIRTTCLSNFPSFNSRANSDPRDKRARIQSRREMLHVVLSESSIWRRACTRDG